MSRYTVFDFYLIGFRFSQFRALVCCLTRSKGGEAGCGIWTQRQPQGQTLFPISENVYVDSSKICFEHEKWCSFFFLTCSSFFVLMQFCPIECKKISVWRIYNVVLCGCCVRYYWFHSESVWESNCAMDELLWYFVVWMNLIDSIFLYQLVHRWCAILIHYVMVNNCFTVHVCHWTAKNFSRTSCCFLCLGYFPSCVKQCVSLLWIEGMLKMTRSTMWVLRMCQLVTKFESW